MNTYINTNTNTYPYTFADIQRDYPEYNTYQPLPDGIHPVVWVERPVLDETKQEITYVGPVEKDGVWTVQWDVHDYAPGEYLKKLVADLAGKPL